MSLLHCSLDNLIYNANAELVFYERGYLLDEAVDYLVQPLFRVGRLQDLHHCNKHVVSLGVEGKSLELIEDGLEDKLLFIDVAEYFYQPLHRVGPHFAARDVDEVLL